MELTPAKLLKNIALIVVFIVVMALMAIGAWNGPQIKTIVPCGFMQCRIIYED